MLLATIISGKADLADFLFLCAFIAALVGTILGFLRHPLALAFVALSLTFGFLGWFVL